MRRWLIRRPDVSGEQTFLCQTLPHNATGHIASPRTGLDVPTLWSRKPELAMRITSRRDAWDLITTNTLERAVVVPERQPYGPAY